MSELPEAVKEAYRAEIRRLEAAVAGKSDEEAAAIQEAISDLEAELVLEDFVLEE